MDSNEMTDAERDQIDSDAETFMKTCSEAIKSFKQQGNLVILSLPPPSAVKVIESDQFVCVCVCVFVRAMLCTTSWVQDYIVHHRPALWTTDLRCAPWCTRWSYVLENWGSPLKFFIFRLFTRNVQKTDTFCPYLMGHKTLQNFITNLRMQCIRASYIVYCMGPYFFTWLTSRWK